MNLIDNVLKTAEKTVTSNIQNLRQQGMKKFVQETGIDVTNLTPEALNSAYEKFKGQNLDKLVNGEYLGEQAKHFGDLLTYSAEELKKEAATISIHGTKIDTTALMTNPEAVLHNTAEAMIDKELDKAVQGKVGEVLKQYGLVPGQRVKDEIKDLVRNTIRGTKNSIFRNPDLKAGLVSAAEDAVNKYYKSAIELLENKDWQEKQLKPLNNMIDKEFKQLDGLQDKLNSKIGDFNSQMDKAAKKLSELEKLDIAKEINSEVTDKLNISGRLNDINKKLGMFGLDQTSLDAVSKNLNGQITGAINNELAPAIQKNIEKLGDINKRVEEVKKYVQKYEDYVKNEIKAFEDKAKEYIKNIESQLLSTVLSSVHLKLGGDLGGIKLKF